MCENLNDMTTSVLAIRRMHQSSKSPHHTLSDNEPYSPKSDKHARRN